MSGESDAKDEFVDIDKVSEDLIKCYQIQVDKDGKATPVFIGSYIEVPLLTHTSIMYDQRKDMLNFNDKTVESGAVKKTRREGKKVKKVGNNIYRIHVVTYMLPEEAIRNKIYKIVGLVVQKNQDSESLCSLDLRFNTDSGKYEYIFVDHLTEKVTLVETLDAFPGSENVLADLASRMFDEPIKSVIIS